MAVSNFIAGEILDVAKLNSLVSQINTNESNEAATNTVATNTANSLLGQKVETQVNLWSGDLYLDGSSNYNLWSSSLHQQWDLVRVYVAYDTRAINGTGGHSFEILCGSSYNFNNVDSESHSTLCTTYDTTYRRLCVTTDGLNVTAGNGGGWYLTKVVGVKYKTL
jgi:hypothetical protein